MRLVLLELVVLVYAIMVLGDVRIRSVVLLPHIMTVCAPFAVTAFYAVSYAFSAFAHLRILRILRTCAFCAISASAVKY